MRHNFRLDLFRLFDASAPLAASDTCHSRSMIASAGSWISAAVTPSASQRAEHICWIFDLALRHVARERALLGALLLALFAVERLCLFGY
jgi:hypothetical protein